MTNVRVDVDLKVADRGEERPRIRIRSVNDSGAVTSAKDVVVLRGEVLIPYRTR